MTDYFFFMLPPTVVKQARDWGRSGSFLRNAHAAAWRLGHLKMSWSAASGEVDERLQHPDGASIKFLRNYWDGARRRRSSLDNCPRKFP